MKYTLNVDYHKDDKHEDHFLNLYRPTPAEEHIPDWYKKLENDTMSRTAKSCRGVYDMMTMGYIAVWNCDVVIRKDENGKLFVARIRDGSTDIFSPHPHGQLGMYPDHLLSQQRVGVSKLLLPYKINTPKGTSIMMIQPSYRPDLKTEIMPGIIDTDKFYSPFNILFTIKEMDTNREIKISAGTPLAQIIPFQRTEWDIDYRQINDKLDRMTDENMLNIDKYYQKKLWTRKVFKRKGK